MAGKDWRQEEADKYARWLTANCESCPVADCGAMVCGEEQKEVHATWHLTIDADREHLRERQKTVETTFVETRDTINTALSTLDTDRDALRNRLTLIEQQFTAAKSQLATLTQTVAALEARVSALEAKTPV